MEHKIAKSACNGTLGRPVFGQQRFLAAAAGASEAASEKPRKTALYDLHVELGGKMVEFAGYLLPVQYKDGVLTSHVHTRSEGCASLFDVSHMGQLRWYGKDAADFLETVLVGDIQGLQENEGRLSIMTTESGGIVDDSVLARFPGYINMVVNGATKHKDMTHLEHYLEQYRSSGSKDVHFEYLDSQQLLALQGPGAASVLQRLVKPDLSQMNFMIAHTMEVAGIPDCNVTRCGYTGEDGFEISVPGDKATQLATALVEADEVKPAGLGARDSLRLEAGLCLYGHDIDETITPVEAGLAWTIAKRRREDRRFLGADTIMDQLKNKTWKKRRVGLFVEKAPAREGTPILNPESGEEVGIVTSGTFSPSLKRPISMGYVQKPHQKNGSQLAVSVRGRQHGAEVTKMPFVAPRYYKVPE